MTPDVRTIRVSTPIAADPDAVFALIIDLPGYNDWLPTSSAYKGTTEVTDTPIVVGTKYIERSPSGTRYGEVCELDHVQRHVAFKQPMRLIFGLEIRIRVDMKVSDTTAGAAQGIHLSGVHLSSVVDRTVTLDFPWYMFPVAGVISGQFEQEIKRTMSEMRKYLENQAT
ncbi:uncharacterized protein AB675_7813 [Cyphellophora attinorum]|uniref:SRPBCC family protein n=1 Tax=Cyphellophora attinorum TaxID=1664694 RepID=A0A0N1H4W2_9EURO|nr:uncharacterized protein AB675_7813 [Phialophora attinorum]KPI40470.1 hypothetical protein AB675_7813 [Phialophora attinorum]